MSMVVGLITLSDANIEEVLRHPSLIWQVVARDHPELGEEGEPRGLLGKLFGFLRKPIKRPEPLAYGPGEGDRTDLDKSWHGLHFLFTGTSQGGKGPLNFIADGGRPVDDIDVGYGPARVFTSRQVAAIHAALSTLDDATLRARFNPEEMTRQEVYPEEIWMRPPEEDDTLGYLMEYLTDLRPFLARTAEKKLGLVVIIE